VVQSFPSTGMISEKLFAIELTVQAHFLFKLLRARCFQVSKLSQFVGAYRRVARLFTQLFVIGGDFEPGG
jgi:hypothetical protein